MAVVTVDEINYSSGHVIEVENRGVRVQAGGVKLVAVLHGQFSKGSKVLPFDDTDHFIHPSRHHTVCPILTDRERQQLMYISEHPRTLLLSQHVINSDIQPIKVTSFTLLQK